MNCSDDDRRDMPAELGKWVLEIDGDAAVKEDASIDGYVYWEQDGFGEIAHMRKLPGCQMRFVCCCGMTLQAAEMLIARAGHVAKVKGWV